MKTLLLSMLFATAVIASHAQRTSAKAPPRKSTARKPVTRTSTAKPNTDSPGKLTTTTTRKKDDRYVGRIALPEKSAPTITEAPNRPHSEKLPETSGSQATPQPVQTPRVSARRRTSGRAAAYSSAGLGYEKNDNLLNIGVGLSSYYYGNPIGVSYEAGINDDFSIGGQFDYNSGSYDDYYGYSYRYRYSAYYLGVRGSYHVNRILKINTKKVDLYAGLGLGYQSFRRNDTYYGSGYGYNYGSGLFANYFIGGKYYFTDKVGAFLELGYTGISSSRVGLAVKF